MENAKIKSHIKNNLRYHREAVGLRQFEIAELLDFKGSDRISKWEHNLAFPNILNLFKLAKLYGVRVEELYTVIES